MIKHTQRAMSLIELLVTIVIVSTLTITILPALASVRDKAENEQSRAKLMHLGQGRDQYALDNQDRIFTYNWIPGEPYTMPDGRIRTGGSWIGAAQYQNQEILMRRTGRLNGASKIRSFNGRLPHRMFTHLILIDYLAGDDDSVFNDDQLAIDPADQNRLVWSENPLQFGPGSGLPYADGNQGGYDSSNSWPEDSMVQRWVFTSSYYIGPASYNADGPDGYLPTDNTPYLFANGGNPDLSGRFTTEVAFPSQKVHMHEDYDREQVQHPWFAYDHARVEKLMFDGSLNDLTSGEANDSYSPDNLNHVWRQRYVPIQHFPLPLGGFGDQTDLNMRFRWTRDGLQGIDYE